MHRCIDPVEVIEIKVRAGREGVVTYLLRECFQTSRTGRGARVRATVRA
jgi:hypothetical protein